VPVFSTLPIHNWFQDTAKNLLPSWEKAAWTMVSVPVLQYDVLIPLPSLLETFNMVQKFCFIIQAYPIPRNLTRWSPKTARDPLDDTQTLLRFCIQGQFFGSCTGCPFSKTSARTYNTWMSKVGNHRIELHAPTLTGDWLDFKRAM
jgi:hypothetical protein